VCPGSIYENNKIEELPVLHQLLASSTYFSSIASLQQQPVDHKKMKPRE
jgi:hypothetical protein